MKIFTKLVVFSLVSGALMSNVMAQSHSSNQPSQKQANQQQAVQTKGVVKIIDLKDKKVTIEHEAIPSLKWPAMTMRFTFSNPAVLGKVKAGDKVTFSFVQQGSTSLLQKIEPVK